MNWRKTVDVKKVLHNDDIPDELKPREIADVLLRSKVFPLSLVTALRKCSGEDYDEEEANALLSIVYDHADKHAIWMGL